MNILFVYEHQYPHLWRDGLWAALQILGETNNITYNNLHSQDPDKGEYDYCLAWGGFRSPADRAVQEGLFNAKRYGLCIGGNAFPPENTDTYDNLFYETNWYKPQIEHHKGAIHAFGINSQIYYQKETDKIFDYITVGSFSNWKRQRLLALKSGTNIAVGEIQRGAPEESYSIIKHLLSNGVACLDMVKPEKLADLYRSSRKCYIPAEIMGGGERAVLEARACGLDVEIEDDNQKLKELLYSPMYDEQYYADQLKKGIC